MPPTETSPTQRLLWISAGNDLAGRSTPALTKEGFEVDVRELGAELAQAAAALAAEDGASEHLVVCDCSGERGYERAFFICRAAPKRRLLLLALGDDVDDAVVTTLMIALLKAQPEAQVAMVTDRAAELSRPTGGEAVMAWQATSLAKLLREIADAPGFEPGTTFRLKDG